MCPTSLRSAGEISQPSIFEAAHDQIIVAGKYVLDRILVCSYHHMHRHQIGILRAVNCMHVGFCVVLAILGVRPNL